MYVHKSASSVATTSIRKEFPRTVFALSKAKARNWVPLIFVEFHILYHPGKSMHLNNKLFYQLFAVSFIASDELNDLQDYK